MDAFYGRANSVINFMIGLDACESDKFSSAGYGKYRPVEDNSTEEGRRQNRRVEIVFVRNDVDFTDPEVVKEMMGLEFGKNFVMPSNEDGTPTGQEDIGDDAAMDINSDRNVPDREYVSKEDAIAGMMSGK